MKNATVRADGVLIVFAKTRKDWRCWLTENHAIARSVWLVIFNKKSGKETVMYEEAVEEALCFGWIDSKPNTRDGESYYQFFSRRNPKSNWSQINRNRAEIMIELGKMTASGREMIELAKSIGTWTALDRVENLELPVELEKALKTYENAFENFDRFPPSAKRGILEWISNAKTLETADRRIQETARLAERNIRALQYPKKD